MRTAKIRLDGEDRILCFSTSVAEDVYEKYGGLEDFFDAMQGKGGNPLSTLIWALERMMDAGARYARRKGIPAAPPLTAEDIREVCDMSDFAGFQKSVMETISNGGSREVQAEPPKNGETTPIGTADP